MILRLKSNTFETMDENSQEMYLQNLEEFVLDEDKIVTYKWLSKTLNIHVNQSKQLLYTFCANKGREVSVYATYLLAGRLRSTGESRITVVGEDKYEDTKSTFETLSSEHVYSIQQTKKTPSGSTLFTADSQPVEGDSTESRGAIRCKESVRRAAEELALLRVTVPPPSSTNVSKPVKAASSSSSSKEPVKTSPAKSNPDENQKESVAKEAKPKGGLAAMFAAQTTKAATKPASGASSSKNNAKGKKGPGISNFFSKVSKEEMAEKEKAENEKARSNKEKNISPAKVEKEEEVMDVESDDDAKPPSPPIAVKQENKKTESGSKNKNKTTPKVSKQTKQKISKTKEKKNEPKKRKRIVTQDSDSSDEDIFAEEKNPSSREASPEPILRAKALESDEDDEEVIPPTPVAESSNGRVRRKRKVTKDKTFMDENGYMVTQKVNEFESFSESDTENADSKRSKGPSKPAENVDKESPPTASKSKSTKGKAPAKKASPVTSKSPLKSKQQSLMSFFKKKD